MTCKHPNARRATALSLMTSLALLLAAESGACFLPSAAHADAASTSTPGRRPLPGDPNTPDEGGRSGSPYLASASPKATAWIATWIKGIAHLTFNAR